MDHNETKYAGLRKEVKKLELINLSINEDIGAYHSMIEDKQIKNNTVEEIKELVLDLLLATRENANMLSYAISDLTDLSDKNMQDKRG